MWLGFELEEYKVHLENFKPYKEPEPYPCALRLWYNLQIGEQKLLVKVNARIKAQLGKWKAKKKASYGNARLGTVTNDKKPQMKKQKRSDDQRGF